MGFCAIGEFSRVWRRERSDEWKMVMYESIWDHVRVNEEGVCGCDLRASKAS